MKRAIRDALGLRILSDREDWWLRVAGFIWAVGLAVSVASIGLPIWVTMVGFALAGLGLGMFWITV